MGKPEAKAAMRLGKRKSFFVIFLSHDVVKKEKNK